MDPIGLIASVITIIQVVTHAVKQARSIYRAKEELETLQASNLPAYPAYNLLCRYGSTR